MTLLTMIVKMGEGLSKTCAIFFLTLLFSLPLGMIVALLRMSKNRIVSGITRFFISILRGTPLMLQLLAVTYGPYYLCDLPVARNKLIPVVIAFAINYAAYFAEIFRGGFLAVPKGQYEACQVLGMNKLQAMTRVIVPQMFRVALPSITNETITLVKDTALAYVIALAELMHAAKAVVSRDVTPLAYVVAGAIYLVLVFLMTLVFKKLEERYKLQEK